MRINQFLARNTELSRRSADRAIAAGEVTVNDIVATNGVQVTETDIVYYKGHLVVDSQDFVTVKLHKPVGYICSRDGQGGKTIYDILPKEYHHLNPIGRLDKNSSGLLLLTNDGDLANALTHPKFHKIKLYEVALKQPLQPLHQQMITDYGIALEDGVSKLKIEKQDSEGKALTVTMHEGRNRQIRRTFAALGYDVITLHRIQFGDYRLDELKPGEVTTVD